MDNRLFQRIKEIREVSDIDKLNLHIENGWVLIKAYISNHREPHNKKYVLGKLPRFVDSSN